MSTDNGETTMEEGLYQYQRFGYPLTGRQKMALRGAGWEPTAHDEALWTVAGTGGEIVA